MPKAISHVKIPPIKCQGIKSKLIPFIARNIRWSGTGCWIEPFMGSGVVAFNIEPKRAILADTNKHIIQLYKDIQTGKITEQVVRDYLTGMGHKLFEKGGEYFYEMRNGFNQTGGSLPFLFLNRACFNGLMRFNSHGGYNVPFGKKPERFRPAYVTKITNQIARVRSILRDADWLFIVADYKKTMSLAQPDDFVYMDPPYIGRHTDYFNSWSEEDAKNLANMADELSCGFALSMWLENKYRRNGHLDSCWNVHQIRTYEHFYHIGSTETLRNSMTEALVIKEGFATTPSVVRKLEKTQAQNELFASTF